MRLAQLIFSLFFACSTTVVAESIELKSGTYTLSTTSLTKERRDIFDDIGAKEEKVVKYFFSYTFKPKENLMEATIGTQYDLAGFYFGTISDIEKMHDCLQQFESKKIDSKVKCKLNEKESVSIIKTNEMYVVSFDNSWDDSHISFGLNQINEALTLLSELTTDAKKLKKIDMDKINNTNINNLSGVLDDELNIVDLEGNHIEFSLKATRNSN